MEARRAASCRHRANDGKHRSAPAAWEGAPGRQDRAKSSAPGAERQRMAQRCRRTLVGIERILCWSSIDVPVNGCSIPLTPQSNGLLGLSRSSNFDADPRLSGIYALRSEPLRGCVAQLRSLHDMFLGRMQPRVAFAREDGGCEKNVTATVAWHRQSSFNAAP